MKYIVKDSESKQEMEISEGLFENLVKKSKEKGLPFVVNTTKYEKEIVINL